MKITAITAQVKTKGRYSVFIDGKFTFGISELGLINHGLRVGMEFTHQELKDLEEKAELDKIYNMAISQIARRPRSVWEIENYLTLKGLDEPSRKEIVDMLTTRGLLDDREFTKRWVDNRRLLKSISFRKLRLELMQKRVPSNVIDEVLAEDATDEVAVLKTEILRKQKHTRYQDQTKLMQYLSRQGYNYHSIKQALDELKDTN